MHSTDSESAPHTDRSQGVLSRAPRRYLVLVGIVAVITAMRCWPPVVITPDSEGYILLGENLAWNGCFSVSPPQTRACEPTWSSQPPGYPILIAVVRLLLPFSDRWIAVAQSILFAAAAAYFARWLIAVGGNLTGFYAYLLIALLSPITLGWSTPILTELLAATTTLWVFAELLRSMVTARARVVPTALAVGAGMLTRWDQVWLLVPVTVVLILSFGWPKAWRSLVPIGSICGFFYALLIVRAVLAGLSPLPHVIAWDIRVSPGVLAFFQKASLDERATRGFFWPILVRDYGRVDIDAVDSYVGLQDPAALRRMLERLKAVPEKSDVPVELDDQFARAAGSVSRNWTLAHIRVPLTRASRLWEGWLGHPIPFTEIGVNEPTRTLFTLYALAVLAGIGIGIALTSGMLRILCSAALVLALVRTAFLVAPSISALEIRYLDPLFPSLDMLSACVWWRVLRPSRKTPRL